MPSGLRVTLSATAVEAGSPIEFTLSAANEASEEIVVDFPDGQRYDFEVLQDGTVVWRWAADMFFPQVLGRERVPPGESVEWTERLAGGLPAGDYRIRGTLTTSPPIRLDIPLTVEPAPGDAPR